MAKKNKDTLFNEFLADLKAINPAIEEIVKDEKVSAKLREGVLARADYSQSMDDLKAQQDTFNAEVQAARQKIEAWQKWYGDTSQQFATVQQQLEEYKAEYGELSEGDKRKAAKEAGYTKEEFEKRMNEVIQQRDVAALKFVDDLTDLKIEHRQRFNEKLDTAAVYKIAGEKQLPLDVAYKVYTADKEADLVKKDFDERLKQAREDGAREALASHKLPQVSNNPDHVHVLDVADAPRTDSARVSAAVSDFLSRQK
jgi:hypothetical protein